METLTFLYNLFDFKKKTYMREVVFFNRSHNWSHVWQWYFLVYWQWRS